MRSFALLVALLTLPALAKVPAASDADVAKAFRLAYQGDLSDGELIRGIETRFNEKRSDRDRVVCAYLLTFAPRRAMAQPRSVYVDLVLAHPDSKTILGEDALFRLHRMRGDEAYDEGKFPLALQDHSQLLKSPNRMLREYAILKVGWSHLNMKHPAQAFAFWLESLAAILQSHNKSSEKEQNVSPNLVNGLGLALAENRARKDSDFAGVGRLPLDAPLKAQFAAGYEEGLEALTTEEEFALIAKQAMNLSWREDLVKGLFESSKAAASRACRLLYYLEQPGQTLDWASQSRVVESCAQWASRRTDDKTGKPKVAKKDEVKRDPQLLARLEKLLGRYPLTGGQRRTRFEVLRAQKKEALACREGVDWLSDKAEPKLRKNSPVKDISEVCVAAAPLLSAAERNALLDQIDRSAQDEGYLRLADDPLLFVTTAMLKDKGFRTGLAEHLAAHPGSYQETLVPSLVAESLRQKGEPASQLLTLFGEKSGAVKGDSVWRGLLAEKITGLLSQKKVAEAFAALENSLPLSAEEKPSEADTELWLNAIVKAREAQLSADSAQTALEKLLTNGAPLAYPKLTSAILELGAEYDRWDQIWAVQSHPRCPPFSKAASAKFKLLVYDVIASGKWAPPEKPIPSDAELRFIVQLGSASKERSAEALVKVQPAGRSGLVEDLSTLKTVAKRRDDLLTGSVSRRDRITQVTSWVQFLDRSTKQVDKHRWSGQPLYQATNTVLADFCTEARNRLPKMNQSSGHKADTAEQWEQFGAVMQQRLSECEKRRPS